MKDRVLARIKLRPEENSISTGELLNDFDIKNGGLLRTIIHELRVEGYKIASKDLNGQYGYFMAKDKIEIQPTIDDLKGRLVSLAELIKALENWNEPEPTLF